ncbi:MAG: AMP-binding protein [Burkholderiaceae bacterium]
MSRNPITAPIVERAATQPDKLALVIESVGHAAQRWTYGELAHAIAASPPQSGSLLFDPNVALKDQVLGAMAQLNAGSSIVGSTSGTTGQAKRYHRSQASWIVSFEMDQQTFGITADDVIVAPGALSHSLFSYALCQGLYRGATVILSERFRPDQVLQQIARYRASILYGVPTQLKLIVQAAYQDGELPTTALATVRWVLSSGARWFAEVTPALTKLFPGAKIAEFYGASELSFVSAAVRVGEPTAPVGSVGKPMPGVFVEIKEDRIWVHSSGLFEGYLSDPPPDFHERVDDQGRRWMSIGDLGRLDEEGYLYLSGREARKVIVSGKNLYPEEVEQALLSHPAIAQAAVVGRADDLRGERLVAVVITNGLLDKADVIRYLRTALEDFKVPRSFFLAQDWPMTASGKTDVHAIQAGLDTGRYTAL